VGVAAVCWVGLNLSAWAAADILTNSLVPGDPAAVYGHYGFSVAIQGDTALVGSYLEDGVASDTGAVYVFSRQSDGAWLPIQKLTAPDAAARDCFGSTMTIEGDTLIIPARGDTSSQPGKVHVFTRDTAGFWIHTAILRADDGHGGDQFGSSVSLSGDTLAVGAIYDDDTAINAGSIYIFDRDALGTWTQTAKLVAAHPLPEERIGNCVRLDGDILVTGADYAGDRSGTFYVFERDGEGVWGQVAHLTGSDTAPGDQFGRWVGISGTTAVVGALFNDAGASNAGAAYVFDRQPEGEWIETQKLVASDPTDNADLGVTVAIRDSWITLGAHFGQEAGVASGVAYLYHRDGDGAWSQVAKLVNENRRSGDWFGWSLDLDGQQAIFGGPFASPSRGAVFVADTLENYLPTPTPSPTPTPTAAPRTAIQSPKEGKRIDGNRVDVVAELIEGDQADVSQVRFEYRLPAGAGNWQPIPPAEDNHPNPDPDSPWFIHWDVTALPEEDCDLRAVAFSTAGVPDPAPPSVQVTIDHHQPDTQGYVGADGDLVSAIALNPVADQILISGAPDGSLLLKIVIPAAALDGLTVGRIRWSAPTESTAPPAGSQTLIGKLASLTLDSGQTAFSPPISIRFEYPDADQDGVVDGTTVPEASLTIQGLTPLPVTMTRLDQSAVDPIQNAVEAVSSQASVFGVYGLPDASVQGWLMY